VSTVPEISFSPFAKGKGALLRVDFTETELAEIQATPERAAAFDALRVAALEVESAEADVETATKNVSASSRLFNDAKDALLNSVPKRTFLQEWRASVKGR
jgi:hypothetical protein